MRQNDGIRCPIRAYSRLAVVAVFISLVLNGCQKTNYPEPKVTSSLGRPGVCAHCDKKIESVSKEHLITVDGVQYIVCDEKCETGVKDWLKKLDER